MVTIGMSMLVGALVLIAIAQFVMTGQKQTKARKGLTTVALLIGGIGLIGVFVPGTIDFLDQEFAFDAFAAGVDGEPQVLAGVGVVCAVEDTTVTLSATDKFTTVAAGTTHRYRINGGPALTVSNAGTLTASPFNTISILWGNETDGSYYGAVSNEVIPCAGTITYTAELSANGTVTIQVFNEDADSITGSTGEALAAGDVVTLDMNLKGAFQTEHPYGGVIVAEYNKTSIDNVIIDLGGSKVDVPSIYSITLGSDSGTKAYSTPAISDTTKIVGTIVIDVDNLVDPVVANSNITLTWYPNDWFINEDTGGSYDGPAVEDEDDVQTFAYSSSFVLHVT